MNSTSLTKCILSFLAFVLIVPSSLKKTSIIENIVHASELNSFGTFKSSKVIDNLLTQDCIKSNKSSENTTKISCSTKSYKEKDDTKLRDLAWNFFDQTFQDFVVDKETLRIEPQKVLTKEITPVIYIPLYEDFLLDESSALQVIPVHPGMIFQTSNIVRITTKDHEVLKLGLIDNTYNYSQTGVAAVLMEIRNFNNYSIQFTKTTNLSDPIVTYIGTKNDVYPNKIENILIALRQISLKQEKAEGFKKGVTYSYLNLVGLENSSLFSIYKDGLNKYLTPIRANGICAIATGISALLYEKGYAPHEIQERWVHREMYHQGPFSPIRKQVDAAIEFGLEPYQNYDLKWIQHANEGLLINVEIFPTGLKYSETRADGKAGMSDVGIIVSLSFSPVLVEQSTHLGSLLNNFQEFRESEHLHTLNKELNYKEVLYRNLGDVNYCSWAKALYNAKDLSYFADIISDNPSLQNIIVFSNAVNAYQEGSDSLFNYLTGSEWYIQYKEMLFAVDINVDKALIKGTYRQVQGEPLQCVGFAMILTDLYPELGFPDISCATAEMAGKLVPDFVYGIEGRYSTGYGETVLVGKSLTIDDYSPGDFYVIKGSPGHVGAVLAKKGGRLLVADSNRHWDGRVNIFYVDDRNFDAVFGEEKYIVLGHFDSSLEHTDKLIKIIETLKAEDHYGPSVEYRFMNHTQIK